MINKIHFGKRIAQFRHECNLSQSELAEKLGITFQAVSKWECGNTLPDIEMLLELSHLFHVSINELLEGKDLLYPLTNQKAENGITEFISKSYDAKWEEDMQKEHWIERNWEYALKDTSMMNEIAKRIAKQEGLILEIGAGPGGGFMPYVLKENPQATIIISDISKVVVSEWKKHLDKKLDSQNLYYAVFDFTHMPLKDECIDVVADRGGISNTIGDKAKALKEAYRVLKPGGMLVTYSGFINQETIKTIPEDALAILKEKYPDAFEDLYEETVLAGFSQIDSVMCQNWCTDEDESDIANLAKSLGVNLHFTGYVRYCRKN